MKKVLTGLTVAVLLFSGPVAMADDFTLPPLPAPFNTIPESVIQNALHAAIDAALANQGDLNDQIHAALHAGLDAISAHLDPTVLDQINEAHGVVDDILR